MTAIQNNPLKVVIINKSDSTGGAAVVSYRLLEALRLEGVDARMLVCEKLSDSPFVELAAKPSVIRRKFLLERLKIFLANGFNRTTLFKIDTASEGLSIWRHPWVKNADAIFLNWVNQGMLSLTGVKKILELGKPVIWTMHDMWCMTGICHHAASCNHFFKNCGDCPLLGKKSYPTDLSHKIWVKKNDIYSNSLLMKKMAFVAVSSWLKEKCLESSLLKNQRLEVIPNAFRISEECKWEKPVKENIRILFGAARLDDPIKGLDTLKETSLILKKDYPRIAEKLEIALFGNVKNPDSLQGFGLKLINLGILKGEREIRMTYENSDILVSASSYETLPGTLVEAQAYGCIPVAFRRGGQSDIIDNLSTGYMAEYDDDPEIRAKNLAQGILWACKILDDPEKLQKITSEMREKVVEKFSYSKIAGKYISLINSLKAID